MLCCILNAISLVAWPVNSSSETDDVSERNATSLTLCKFWSVKSQTTTTVIRRRNKLRTGSQPRRCVTSRFGFYCFDRQLNSGDRWGCFARGFTPDFECKYLHKNSPLVKRKTSDDEMLNKCPEVCCWTEHYRRRLCDWLNEKAINLETFQSQPESQNLLQNDAKWKKLSANEKRDRKCARDSWD